MWKNNLIAKLVMIVIISMLFVAVVQDVKGIKKQKAQCEREK